MSPPTQNMRGIHKVAGLQSNLSVMPSVTDLSSRAPRSMPQELLSFPPLYVVVGIFRLFTDPVLRDASWDKVRHATYRGAAVSILWAVLSWPWQHWFVKTFLVGSGGWWGKKVPEATADGMHVVGNGAFALNIVLCKPQLENSLLTIRYPLDGSPSPNHTDSSLLPHEEYQIVSIQSLGFDRFVSRKRP